MKNKRRLLSNLDLLAIAPGGVARLSELILTLAVHGKLVPQGPADEPACKLLKKMGVEKNLLIAAGAIKRDKALAQIADKENRLSCRRGGNGRGLVPPWKCSMVKPTEWLASGLPIVRSQNLNKLTPAFNYCHAAAVSEKTKLKMKRSQSAGLGHLGASFEAFFWCLYRAKRVSSVESTPF